MIIHGKFRKVRVEYGDYENTQAKKKWPYAVFSRLKFTVCQDATLLLFKKHPQKVGKHIPRQVLQSDLVWTYDLFHGLKWPPFGESKGQFDGMWDFRISSWVNQQSPDVPWFCPSFVAPLFQGKRIPWPWNTTKNYWTVAHPNPPGRGHDQDTMTVRGDGPRRRWRKSAVLSYPPGEDHISHHRGSPENHHSLKCAGW